MVLRKLSQTFKVTLALMLSVLSSGILQVAPAYAYSATNPDGEFKKVYVCKYVGTPGVNEQLQTGDNPISVSTSSLKGFNGLGSYFNDKHEKSVAIAWDNGDKIEPAISMCDSADSGDNEVTPLPSGIKDVCGPNNDTVPSTDTATYTVEDDSDWSNNSRTVTYETTGSLVFSESDGWTVSADGKTATYTYQDWNTACAVNPCSANYFTDYKMWEITWGTQHTDTNGVSTFDMQSHGGLVSVNNKPVPSYMTPDWHWLYVTEAEVNNGRTVTYGFADGTIITAVVSANANNCPAVEWTTTPPPTVTICEEALPTIHSTNLDQNGWTLPMDAAYVDGGIKLNVSGTNPDTSWDETYIERSFVGPLADIGDQIDFTASPEQYVGIHIVTDKGVLVYEKEGSYAGKWWSKSDFGATASGMGYATFDTLANIVAKNPGVMTSALRILYTNPAATSSTVNSVTVGCAIYTFSHEDDETPTNPGNVLGDNDDKTPTTGKVLSTSTVLPATLPATGGSTASPFMIIIAALMAYGAAYFIQGRRILARNQIEV